MLPGYAGLILAGLLALPVPAPEGRDLPQGYCAIREGAFAPYAEHWELRYRAAEEFSSPRRMLILETGGGLGDYWARWYQEDIDGSAFLFSVDPGKRVKRRRISTKRWSEILEELSRFDLDAMESYQNRSVECAGDAVVTICDTGERRTFTFSGVTSEVFYGEGRCGSFCDLIEWLYNLESRR